MLTAAERAQLITDLQVELPDVCTITRASTSEPTFDPDTGTYTTPAPTTLYSGIACRAAPFTGDRVVQAGEEPVTLRFYNVTLPVTTTGIEVDDLIAVTTSADPDLVGTSLRVRDSRASSMGAQRRVTAEVVLG